ncbi:MAG: CopG family transcriptional regulator [Ornithinimicrobium sp.]
MRTTVNLDEDVLLAVQERAKREGRTASAVLSDLARAALTGEHRTMDHTPEGVGGFVPLPRRGPVISNALIDRLREEDGE